MGEVKLVNALGKRGKMVGMRRVERGGVVEQAGLIRGWKNVLLKLLSSVTSYTSRIPIAPR